MRPSTVPQPGDSGAKARLLGRVVPDKGVHTVIEAFGLLGQSEETRGKASLTILGDGPANYMHHLRQRVTTLGIDNLVDFMAPVRRERMPEVLSRYNVQIMPSEYGEPIARSMQEGMAMGLLVIGLVTGGSGELLQHEHNGLVFPAGDARALTNALVTVHNALGRLRQMGENSRHLASAYRAETWAEHWA